MNLHLDVNTSHREAGSIDDVSNILLGCGLRPTRQRVSLLKLLLTTKRRYLTAESLYDEAVEGRCRVSRATVCSALRQFETGWIDEKNPGVKIAESLVYLDGSLLTCF